MFAEMNLKKSAAPLKVKNLIEKKSWFMILITGAADFFKCMIAKIGAFLKFLIFLKLSYFCDKHLISFEDNTISQILIFHTALLLSPSCFLFYSFFFFIFFCLLFLHISSPTFRTSPLLSGHISHIWFICLFLFLT